MPRIHERETEILEAQRPPLRYLVSFPPRYAQDPGPWPVLCFLHGRGEDGRRKIINAMTAADLHGPLKGGRACEMVDRFIVVAPQLPEGEVWRAGHADEVRRIVEGVARGNPRRRFLTGFSSGGDGVLSIAAAPGNFWSKAWAVDPSIVAGHPRCPLWLSMGTLSRRKAKEFQESPLKLPAPLNLSRIPPDRVDARIAAEIKANNRRVCVDEGQKDVDVDPATRRQFVDSGHVRTATRAYARNRIYEWLLA